MDRNLEMPECVARKCPQMPDVFKIFCREKQVGIAAKQADGQWAAAVCFTDASGDPLLFTASTPDPRETFRGIRSQINEAVIFGDLMQGSFYC